MLEQLEARNGFKSASQEDLIHKQEMANTRFSSSLETVELRLFEASVAPQSKYAKKYSKDPQTSQLGGDLGWINPQTYPIKEIGLALPIIKKEECSPPINTSFGFHLLWLEKIKVGGQPNLKDHWPKIEALSLNNKKMIWYEKWIKKEKEKYFIEILN